MKTDAPSGSEVTIARAEERDVLANLMQLYIHDFSEHWTGTSKGDLGNDGRFPEYPNLDSYWRDPDRIALLVRVNGRLAGFALLNAVSHSGRPADRNMAEFFIARKYRRSGIGTAAAQTIFTRFPGQWEAAVARQNTGALTFWRNAIAKHPRVQDIEETDVAAGRWDGAILRFRIAPA